MDYRDQGTVICILPRLWSRWAGLRRACGSYIRLIPALFVITTWFTGLGAFLSSTTSASHQHTARECIWSAPCHTEPSWKTARLQINWWNNNKMRWYSAYWDGYTGWNSFISKILASQNLALIWRWVIYFIYLLFFCITRFVCLFYLKQIRGGNASGWLLFDSEFCWGRQRGVRRVNPRVPCEWRRCLLTLMYPEQEQLKSLDIQEHSGAACESRSSRDRNDGRALDNTAQSICLGAASSWY